MENSFLSHLSWRFAVTDFDPQRKVSEEDLQKILEAIRMAPSSFGLQPYHIFVITNEELRKRLREKGFNQPKITEGSHFLVFASRTDILERIENYMQMASGGDSEIRAKMKGYEDMMKGSMQGKSTQDLKTWSDRQTYIALGFGLAACAELGIDSGPMEGFEPPAYDQILNLPESMKSVVAMAIGYRAHDPERPKVRFSNEDLFSFIP